MILSVNIRILKSMEEKSILVHLQNLIVLLLPCKEGFNIGPQPPWSYGFAALKMICTKSIGHHSQPEKCTSFMLFTSYLLQNESSTAWNFSLPFKWVPGPVCDWDPVATKSMHSLLCKCGKNGYVAQQSISYRAPHGISHQEGLWAWAGDSMNHWCNILQICMLQKREK